MNDKDFIHSLLLCLFRRNPRRAGLLLCCLLSCPIALADDQLPIVPDGFVVDVVAREPMVSNPCVMAFDRLGRIFVAQGPQWRGPAPETPGDRVDTIIDQDGDDQEESGLAVRVASSIRVQCRIGNILNDRGEQNGAQDWGKEATWFDYFVTIDHRKVAETLLQRSNQ